MKYLLVLASLCLIGCDHTTFLPPKYETVTIVAVVKEPERGVPNSYTIVEFPDGTRRHSWYTYGEVGDTFQAYKSSAWQWDS